MLSRFEEKMKIIVLNGSHRKNGATASILGEMVSALKQYPNVQLEYIHVADLELQYCTGCCSCYKTGHCIFHDDVEKLSQTIGEADALIIGSPTYASNISGQLKVIVDRGHFVIEQLLHGKYAISVTTYENYGGSSASKFLNRLLSYSGAKISSRIAVKLPFSSEPKARTQKKAQRLVKKLYFDIKCKHRYPLQSLKHYLIFRIGLRPFVRKKGDAYDGVVGRWKEMGLVKEGEPL